MMPDPQPSSTTFLFDRNGFRSSGTIDTRKRNDELDRLAIHSRNPSGRSGLPYRPCSQPRSFASQNSFGSTGMFFVTWRRSEAIARAISAVESFLEPLQNRRFG